MIDINERLFLASLKKILDQKGKAACSLKKFQEAVALEEDFFLSTVSEDI